MHALSVIVAYDPCEADAHLLFAEIRQGNSSSEGPGHTNQSIQSIDPLETSMRRRDNIITPHIS